MSFFNKLFHLVTTSKEKEVRKIEVNLSLDDAFVHNFVKKGGKFLYCTSKKEVSDNINQIIAENNWEEVVCLDKKLNKFIKNTAVKISTNLKEGTPIFTSCEHLISDCGDVLFSSNQLKSNKLAALSDNFVVYATTSQLVKDTGEGLTGIKANNKGNLPTNISAIKSYVVKKNAENLLNYGNSNTKNLYLLLFENL